MGRPGVVGGHCEQTRRRSETESSHCVRDCYTFQHSRPGVAKLLLPPRTHPEFGKLSALRGSTLSTRLRTPESERSEGESQCEELTLVDVNESTWFHGSFRALFDPSRMSFFGTQRSGESLEGTGHPC